MKQELEQIYKEFSIEPSILKLGKETEEKLKERFDEIDLVKFRMLHTMHVLHGSMPCAATFRRTFCLKSVAFRARCLFCAAGHLRAYKGRLSF